MNSSAQYLAKIERRKRLAIHFLGHIAADLLKGTNSLFSQSEED